MEAISEWIVQWFLKNANADEMALRENMEENYFDKGFIDSFTFISLIAEAEETYAIEFDNDQFIDRKFATVTGLADIINKLRGKNEK